MITLQDLCKKLLNGEVTFECNGHFSLLGNGGDTTEAAIRYMMMQGDNPMVASIQELRIGVDIHVDGLITGIRENPCPKCGHKNMWMYDAVNKRLICMNGDLKQYKRSLEWDWVLGPENNCPEGDVPATKFRYKIEEPILFANFFEHHMDAEDELDTESGIAIMTNRGRQKLTQHYASKGVGYQQTDDCTVTLFVNAERTEIIILRDLDRYDGHVHNAEEELPPLGWAYVGEITCEMWRYMFIPKSKLDPMDEQQEMIEIVMEKGDYLVENFYDSKEKDDHKLHGYNICSRIKLIPDDNNRGEKAPLQAEPHSFH